MFPNPRRAVTVGADPIAAPVRRDPVRAPRLRNRLDSGFRVTDMAGASTPAIRTLVRAAAEHRVHAYTHDPRADSYGTEAVDALATDLGLDPAQIFKTLVLELSTGSLAVAVLPVPRSLSLKAAAAALGAPKAAMADRVKAERSTGYVLGGISPLGQRKTLPTVVDASANRWERVLCSAGRRGLEIELAPADLIRLTDAVVAPVAAG
ncbi:Cys-tRNA(Pro)/Cys-tRNA(Cys) deacylase ybaK [Nocardia cyriacigeorgica]|uniref:Cys-tRNA(Pro)/Cys-tRNA(Cys) deacylase ybaK n=2 Tax=Nocardia cyriacigeorgica TaxID=135487 RepID=A0A4U8W0E6_9NOCA|nr:Cys-tRNA(Pro)/Cys-tRNA(Cys) deacylase ybaK [Nocardia cyriacigeorgica]